MLLGGVRIDVEVTYALELQVGECLHRRSEGLYVAMAQHGQGIRIDDLLHGRDGVALLSLADGSQLVAWVLHLPQAVIETHFCRHGIMA